MLCTDQFETRTSPPPGIPWAFDPLPCPGRREFDRPQRPWGGAFDHNIGLIRCLDFMFRAALCKYVARARVWNENSSTSDDFRGQSNAFVNKWLDDNGLGKLASVFEGTSDFSR